jgi:hypothetical protein
MEKTPIPPEAGICKKYFNKNTRTLLKPLVIAQKIVVLKREQSVLERPRQTVG